MNSLSPHLLILTVEYTYALICELLLVHHHVNVHALRCLLHLLLQHEVHGVLVDVVAAGGVPYAARSSTLVMLHHRRYVG